MTDTTGAQAAPPSHDATREKTQAFVLVMFLVALLTLVAIASLAFGLAGLTLVAVGAAWAVLALLVLMTAGN